jgi:hypothetical protein
VVKNIKIFWMVLMDIGYASCKWHWRIAINKKAIPSSEDSHKLYLKKMIKFCSHLCRTDGYILKKTLPAKLIDAIILPVKERRWHRLSRQVLAVQQPE